MRLAVLASIVLHAAAVGGLYVLFSRTPVPIAPEPAAEEPAIEMVAVPVSIEQLTPPPPEPPPPQPPPPEPPKPRPPAPVPDAPQAVTSSAPATEPSAPVAPIAPPGPPTPPAPPAPSAPAVFSGASDPGYYAKVQALIAAEQRYPEPARRRREEGSVLLWFVINPSGKVLAFRIDQPSGSPLLDREVARMIKSIQRFPPVPAQHRNHPRIEFRIPVNFRLRSA